MRTRALAITLTLATTSAGLAAPAHAAGGPAGRAVRFTDAAASTS
ncbi:hypothetical protein ACFQY7_38400 [Actinomadura luteofluorescens]